MLSAEYLLMPASPPCCGQSAAVAQAMLRIRAEEMKSRRFIMVSSRGMGERVTQLSAASRGWWAASAASLIRKLDDCEHRQLDKSEVNAGKSVKFALFSKLNE